MNSPDLTLPDVPAQIPCKVCGGMATYIGSVDFNRPVVAGAIVSTATYAPSGVLVPHHRCGRCGFMFTAAMDHLTLEDFARHIYNDGYAAVDPEYLDVRPKNVAATIAANFPQARQLRVLDYGGGSGRTAEHLRANGFERVEVYDPFVPRFSRKPEGTYDLIVCAEVAEHVPQPRALFSDLARLLADPGLVLFTTKTQPKEIERLGLSWWYVGPRNGHISFYTPESLACLAQQVRLRYATVDGFLHFLLHGSPPAFAARLFAHR